MDTAQRPTDSTTEYARTHGVTVEDIEPGTPEWDESERALGYAPFVPEWRRRSLEGRNRFDAVNDQTDSGR